MSAATATPRDALLPRPPPGMGRGAMLALVAHGLLVAALAFGVRWRTSEPEGVTAELWAAVPQLAAPEPVRTAPPQPAPAPPPPKAEPPAVPKVEAPPDPQIAIEREKREREKREAEEQAAREKAARERAEREKAERSEREKQERERAERERRDTEKLAALREENLKRMHELAGGARPGTGTAAQTAGPSAGYAGRIKARIKPNIVLAESVDGNPVATVEVRAAPDGTIIGRRLLRASGVKAWDEAVLRAIDKTEVLPRDTDGRVPPTIEIEFRVRE